MCAMFRCYNDGQTVVMFAEYVSCIVGKFNITIVINVQGMIIPILANDGSLYINGLSIIICSRSKNKLDSVTLVVGCRSEGAEGQQAHLAHHFQIEN